MRLAGTRAAVLVVLLLASGVVTVTVRMHLGRGNAEEGVSPVMSGPSMYSMPSGGHGTEEATPGAGRLRSSHAKTAAALGGLVRPQTRAAGLLHGAPPDPLAVPLNQLARLHLQPWEWVTDDAERERMVPKYQFVEVDFTVLPGGAGDIVTAGGYSTYYQSTWPHVHMFSGGRWSVLSKLPKGAPRTHVSLSNLDGKWVYLVGGQYGIACGYGSTDIRVIDMARPRPDSNMALFPLALPKPRYLAGTVVVETWLVVVGGAAEDRQSAARDTWAVRLDRATGQPASPAGWVTLPPVPVGGSHGVGGVVGSTVFFGLSVFGDAKALPRGHTIEDCHHHPETSSHGRIFSLDVAAEKPAWVELESMQEWRHMSHAPGLVLGDSLVVFGGVRGVSGKEETVPFVNVLDITAELQRASLPTPGPQPAPGTHWRAADDLLFKLKGHVAITDGAHVVMAHRPWFKTELSGFERRVDLAKIMRAPFWLESPLVSLGPDTVIQPLHVATTPAEAPLAVTPLVLNLDSRPDRLARIAQTMSRLHVPCFARFQAIRLTAAEAAVKPDTITRPAFNKAIAKLRADPGAAQFLERQVVAGEDKMYAGHASVFLAMVRMFDLGAVPAQVALPVARKCQNINGFRVPNGVATDPAGPVLIMEDDVELAVPPDEFRASIAAAVDELRQSGEEWHLLYPAYRQAVSWDEGTPSRLTHSVRLRGVLGNTAMVVNPAKAEQLSKWLISMRDGDKCLLDHAMYRGIQRADIKVWRTTKRLMRPYLSQSDLTGKATVYADTAKGKPLPAPAVRTGTSATTVQ